MPHIKYFIGEMNANMQKDFAVDVSKTDSFSFKLKAPFFSNTENLLEVYGNMCLVGLGLFCGGGFTSYGQPYQRTQQH